MKKVTFFSLIASLVVLTFMGIGLSYSWMNIEALHETNRYMIFDLTDASGHNLSIEEVNYTMTLYYSNSTTTTKTWKVVPQTTLTLLKTGFVPGDVIHYYLDFTNNSATGQNFSLGLKGLDSSYTGATSIFNYLDLTVQRILENSNPVLDVPLADVNIGSHMSTSGTVIFYSGFTVPASTTYRIYFDLIFKTTATYEYAGESITIQKVTIAQL